ncbi:MAG: hypothetical protein R3E02_07970 [Blastomonas sp.]
MDRFGLKSVKMRQFPHSCPFIIMLAILLAEISRLRSSQMGNALPGRHHSWPNSFPKMPPMH